MAAGEAGVPVELAEMRPVKSSPAHHTELFAELVCSNSLRAANIENAVGLLKEEMRRLGSIIMESADTHRVPAGGALAVDRVPFSQFVTDRLRNHPLITIRNEEITELPDDQICIVATGPLTSDAMAETIRAMTGADYFHFHDAAAPIVTVDSLDMSKVYRAARYGKGRGRLSELPLYEGRIRSLLAGPDDGRMRRAARFRKRMTTSSKAACLLKSWPPAASTRCATAP